MIDFKIYSVLISKQDYSVNCIYNSIPYNISYLAIYIYRCNAINGIALFIFLIN